MGVKSKGVYTRQKSREGHYTSQGQEKNRPSKSQEKCTQGQSGHMIVMITSRKWTMAGRPFAYGWF